MEVDHTFGYHDVVTAENWGAVAAATWLRRLAEANLGFPMQF